jgi:hypothetical protein
MGFATGPVASDGPVGDSVVRVTLGSGCWGRRGRSRRAQRGIADPIPGARPFRTRLGESHGTLPHRPPEKPVGGSVREDLTRPPEEP